MINYLNLWTLQGEQVSIPVDGFYQYWGATPHVTRYGTAAVMVSQSGYDTTAEQWSEWRELLLIDLETQVILSRETLAPGQWLVRTGDGAAEYVLGTLQGTTLSLQAYDLMPGSSSFSEPVGEAIQLGVSSALADTLGQFRTNLYAASGVGAEGQTASDYLLVGAPGEQNQNVITIHPISGDGVGDAIGTRVGWLSEFFVNAEALWLSVWDGSASAFSAFVPSSGEFSALSGDVYFEARDIALDVSSVVRTEDGVIELRALGLGIPDDAEIWTDMDWAIETLADGWLFVRAEIFPADAALGYEHWMLFDPEGVLIAHKAFADGAGLLMRSIDDGEDGAIYFQQIHTSGSFPDWLQAVDESVTVHRIVADSTSIKALLDAPAAIETLAGQAAVEQVASYSQQQLGQTEPLPAGRIWVLDGYAPLEGDGGALALGTIVELATDQDLSGLLVISRGLEGGGLQTDVVLLPGEVEELFFAPERVADTLLASVRIGSSVIAVKVDLATAQVGRVDEELFFNLLEGRNSESFELALSDGPPQWVTLSVDALGGVGAVPAMPSLVALTAKPLVVASSSDFALVQLGYLAADGTTGAILARLEASETGWTVVDATPIDGQVVELDPVFSPGGVLEAVGVVVMDIGNTGLQVSVVEVSSGAVMAPQPIATLPLETTLDTLNLSPYATITAKFGPEGDALEGPNGEQTFNIAVVLRTEDPQVPAGQSAVDYRSLMFVVTETAEGEIVSAVAVGDTLGLRSLPAYQQSGIVAYESARLFDETPNAVVFIGVDGSTVSATVTGSALIAGLAGVDASVAPAQLAARLLEYNPDMQTFLFALREFTDTSFLQQTGRTFLVRLGWEGESAVLSHLDTVLLPTGFNGYFDGVRLVPSEHDGALHFALGQELDRGFVPYRAFKVDYTTGSPQAVELAEPGQFLVVEAAYLGPDLLERYGTEGNDTLTAVEGGEALYGLGGNDIISGGNGNDFIDGGPGDDRLSGGAGADTVIGGSGTDRIRYFSPAELAGDTVSGTSAFYSSGDPASGGDPSTADRIQLFGPGAYDFAAAASISYLDRIDIVADSGRFDVRLTAEMAASADGNGDGGYGDIHVVGYGTAMDSPATTAQLFLDASALTAAQSVVVRGQVGSGVDGLQAFGGLSGDDSIIGGAGADWIHAGAGDDYLYGGDGADTLDGGAGDDVLIGGPGADVYSFGWGSSQDLVYNNGWDDALDTVELGAGIKQADVALTRDLDDLLISLVGSTDSLRVKDHFSSSEPNASKVDRLHFAEDGTVWDLSNFDPTGSVSITGTAIQGQTLTVSNTLADLDGLGPISYQWNANGTGINGATGSAYTLTQAEVGKIITVTASYIDGGGTGESVTSAATESVVADGGAEPPVEPPPSNPTIGDGIVTTPIGLADDFGYSVALQADGKIVVAGQSWNGTSYDFALVRYNENGSLDSSFNGSGKVTKNSGELYDSRASVAVQADGKVLIGGTSWDGERQYFTVVRYNADGSLDSGFGEGGHVQTAFGYMAYGHSMALQADGKILLAGVAGGAQIDDDDDFALVRYNSDGSPDLSFDGDGKVLTGLGWGWSVTVQPDGKIVVAGDTADGAALVRYNADGSLDSTFSDDGIATATTGSGYFASYGVAIQPDGKILLTGEDGYRLFLIRFNADGSLDTGFGVEGKVLLGGDSIGYGVSLQPDGRILVAGWINDGIAVARFFADGTVDSDFGTGGVARPTSGASSGMGRGVIVQLDGKILVVGESWGGQDSDFALLRLNTDGTLDSTFGADNNVPSGAVTISGTTSLGQILAAANDLADPDGLGTISYRWYADGGTISGATNSTYTLTESEVGKVITVTATYIDGGGTLESVTSAATLPVEDAYALPIESGLVIDGYVSGATVSRGNGSGNTVTTDASGRFTGLTGTGPMIATGGIDVVTGQEVGFTMRAPEGATVISPLTTLVQALVDGGVSTAAAYDSVAAKLGLTVTQLQSDPWASSGSEDLAVIKVAVQVASLLRAAVIEGADDVLAVQALLNALISANDLSDPEKLESFFGDSTLGIGNAKTLAETLAQANAGVADAPTVGDLQEAQSRPTVTITLSDVALKAGETATVTFTFSEEPTGFSLEDVQAENGQLTDLQVKADSSGLVYTATFTPNAAVEDSTNVFTVGSGWTDSVGNVPAGGATSGNYAVDTAVATELSNLTGQVLTRKGQALPDFEAKLALSTLDQLDLALVQETVALDGSRTLRFALTVDCAAQAFGAFDLALRTEAGVEIIGLTLGDAFASWTSIPNPLSAQQLLVGAFSANPDPASYLSGELALGELVVRMGADHTGPLRIAVEELALSAAPVQSGVLRYESAEDLGAGQFAFLGLEDGQIDLQFVGDTSNIGRSITAQDALEALRLAVRIPSDYSDAYGLISADYNQDGRVTSQDALEILKTSVRMPDAIQPQWVFLSDEADLSAVNSRDTGYKSGLTLEELPVDASHNFTAVLLGDVNDSLVFV